MVPIIEFNDFSWMYKASTSLVLKSINLKIHRGEFIGLMGPTGAGKSTLCRCINGLIPLRTKGWIRGTVHVLGMNTRTAKMSELGSRVGLIFQDPETQFIMMTVEDEIALGLETLGLDRNEIRKRIEWALHIVDMDGFENKTPEDLSGGEKQRVAIASILAMRPEILILDEPTSDLDPQGKNKIFQILEKIRNQFDLTIILVSHETEKILHFCNRIIVLQKGEIQFDGHPSKLFQDLALPRKIGIAVPTYLSFRSFLPESTNLLDPIVICQDLIKNLKNVTFTFFEKEKMVPLAPKHQEPVIEVIDLSYTYPNGTQALKDINLQIYPGEFLAIIGKNGSGKTTLVKHFNGLLKAKTGKILLYQTPIDQFSISEISQKVGFCFQNPDHQLFKNTIRDEIEFGLKNLKFPQEEITLRYNEITDLLNLKQFEKTSESSLFLSKGIRQRLALASILVMKPKILIIDEPTTGQDFQMIEEFMKILQKLHSQNHTIIIITHDPRVISYYSKSIVILDNGKLIKKLPTSAFLCDTKLQQIAAFTLPTELKIIQTLQKKGLLPSSINDPKILLDALNRLLH